MKEPIQNSTTSDKRYTNDLLEIIQKLSLAKDLETIMFIVRKAARKLTNADGSTFVLKDNGQCYYAAEDAIAPLWEGKRFPMSICVSGWVMQHRESVVIPDVYHDPRVPVEAYRPTFVKSLAMVPIRTHEPIGAIGTYWAEKYLPTPEQINLLQALADSTSVAMENIHLLTRLEEGHRETSAQLEITKKLMESNRELELALSELNHRNEEMKWLKELSSKLQMCLHVEEAYQLIGQYTQQLLPDMPGGFYIMHNSRNFLELVSSWGNPAFKDKIMKPEDCFALRQGAAHCMQDAHHLRCEHILPQIKNTLCIPLSAQSEVIGLFTLQWDETEHTRHQKNNETIAHMISEQIALGIANIQLRETLRNQSVRDPLTGLYNRRYLEITLEREMSRCLRKDSTLAILMVDVDHFKQFNDEFGHDAGDLVLKNVGEALGTQIRKDDVAARYGGEEFILVLTEITAEEAFQRAKALHETMGQIHLNHHGVELRTITISVGIAIFPIHGQTIPELIEAADHALYTAKNTGRNKSVIYYESNQ